MSSGFLSDAPVLLLLCAGTNSVTVLLFLPMVSVLHHPPCPPTRHWDS
jgi:hypothetical protein